jgi:hypothetical protein
VSTKGSISRPITKRKISGLPYLPYNERLEDSDGAHRACVSALQVLKIADETLHAESWGLALRINRLCDATLERKRDPCLGLEIRNHARIQGAILLRRFTMEVQMRLHRQQNSAQRAGRDKMTDLSHRGAMRDHQPRIVPRAITSIGVSVCMMDEGS